MSAILADGIGTTRPFLDRLRDAVLPDGRGELVFVANFEVEHEWAEGAVRLPGLGTAAATAVVNRMDQFALLLADARSHVVLSEAPDPDHLDHLEGVGVELPGLIVLDAPDPLDAVTVGAARDGGARGRLADLGRDGVRLLPHGSCRSAENLAAVGNIALAAPSADVCRELNSKVYSRRLADEHGIAQPLGWSCTDVGELRAAIEAAVPWLAEGPVVVKEAFGVSGKGLAVVDSERRLRRLGDLVVRRAEQTGGRIAFCVERWLPRRLDVNYHLVVGTDGRVRFDGVAEALTESGVHKGHRYPARLSRADLDLVAETAEVVGGRLARDGYFGVVGVDGLVDADGVLHPLIEINARFNMSTYQLAIRERMGSPAVRACHYPVPSTVDLHFRDIRHALGDDLMTAAGGSGAVVANFSTVNAARAVLGPGVASVGRLYVLLFASDDTALAALDGRVAARLAGLRGRV